jgi:dihydrofolate reductase
MRVSIIAAMAKNRVIGINNTLPWHLPEDLKHFKGLTMGHHIIMGRKTFESIGKPLPGRTTVIVTRSRDYQIPGCITVHAIQEAIEACQGDDEVFFVGGADLYLQALAVAQRIYLTEIQAEYEGDAHFPAFDPEFWREASRTQQASGSGGLEFHFVVYDHVSTSNQWEKWQ